MNATNIALDKRSEGERVSSREREREKREEWMEVVKLSHIDHAILPRARVWRGV